MLARVSLLCYPIVSQDLRPPRHNGRSTVVICYVCSMTFSYTYLPPPHDSSMPCGTIHQKIGDCVEYKEKDVYV